MVGSEGFHAQARRHAEDPWGNGNWGVVPVKDADGKDVLFFDFIGRNTWYRRELWNGGRGAHDLRALHRWRKGEDCVVTGYEYYLTLTFLIKTPGIQCSLTCGLLSSHRF